MTYLTGAPLNRNKAACININTDTVYQNTWLNYC